MGQLDHPELLDAEMRIIKAAKANGLHIGIGTGHRHRNGYISGNAGVGVNWVQCGNGFEYMNRFAEQLTSNMRK